MPVTRRGNWGVAIAVLAVAALGFGLGYGGMSLAYPALHQSPKVIQAPTPSAHTHTQYVIEPAPAPSTRAPPNRGLGQASIPGVPYTPSPTPSPSPTPTASWTHPAPTEVPSSAPSDTGSPILSVSGP